MPRTVSKPQALVDYAGVIGVAWLRGPNGATLATSLRHDRSAFLDDASFLRVPGALCAKPSRHVVKQGGYTLTIHAAAGISPYAVAGRLEGCRKLLRALGEAPVDFTPPGSDGGGTGPANAELRVWAPPRHRGRG